MIKTLITRLKMQEQYNSVENTILWKDSGASRWNGVYGELSLKDNGFFITGDELLIGEISEINQGESFLLNKVKEVTCSNDQFLQVNAAYPELISRVKANFQPFIHPLELDLNKIINEINDKNFVSYYIILGYPKYNSFAHSLKINDRVVIVNEDGSLNNVKKHSLRGLEEFGKELDISTNVEGLTIDEMIMQNQAFSRESKKSNNVTRLKNIEIKLKQGGVYKFTSFFAYHDTLYNKKVYLNNSNNQDTKASQMARIINLNGAGLYKVSHGSFKANKNKHIIEALKQNNWITIHESTGKGRGDKFKNKLKKDDYVYITLGGEELIGIARIVSNRCEYIPKEIINDDGWLFREIEMIQEPIKKGSFKLKDTRAIYPSGNTSLFKIKNRDLKEANQLLFNPYFNVEFIDRENTSASTKKNTNYMDLPLNQILFGPPGTGKTYSTIDKVIQICEPYKYQIDNRESNKVLYDQLITEGRAFFTTFHQSMTYEDFIEGIKPISPKKETDAIQYRVEDGIFKSVCEQCLDEIKEVINQKNQKPKQEVTYEEKYAEFVRQIQAGLIEVKTRSGLIVKMTKVSPAGNMRLMTGEDTRDYIVSANRLKRLVEEIPQPENITNVHDEIRNVIGGSHSSLYFAALSAFVKFEKKYVQTIKEEGKQLELEDIKLTNAEIDELPKYAFVIDEINRGNVSAIFGELITLLEEDKRFGKENQLFVKLPYSKLNFIVPPNLYIIGTMNTADRSVEALDTALRRRFSFTEMPPLYDLKELDYPIASTTGKQILETINKRIEKLLDRDHLIGHSYFLLKENEVPKKKLINSFYRNIIPLMQEYFFGDYAKIGAVLGKGFITMETDKDETIFADGFDQEDFSEKEIYQIIDYRDNQPGNKYINDGMNFEMAIKALISNTLT